jgi:hypothetical protein
MSDLSVEGIGWFRLNDGRKKVIRVDVRICFVFFQAQLLW